MAKDRHKPQRWEHSGGCQGSNTSLHRDSNQCHHLEDHNTFHSHIGLTELTWQSCSWQLQSEIKHSSNTSFFFWTDGWITFLLVKQTLYLSQLSHDKSLRYHTHIFGMSQVLFKAEAQSKGLHPSWESNLLFHVCSSSSSSDTSHQPFLGDHHNFNLKPSHP